MEMLVGALVSFGLLDRLRQVSKDYQIVPFPNVTRFCSAVTMERFDAFVLDPAMVRWQSKVMLAHTLEVNNNPLIVYASPTPTALRYTLEILHLGACDLLICDYGDDKPTLRRTFNALPNVNPAVRFIVHIREPLGRLHFVFLPVLLGVLTAGPIPATKAIGNVMSSSRRSVDRWLFDAGLRPASWFLSAAQFLRVMRELEAGNSIDAVIQYGSYSSRDSFQRQVRRLTGLPYDQAAALARDDPPRLITLVAARSMLNAVHPARKTQQA